MICNLAEDGLIDKLRGTIIEIGTERGHGSTEALAKTAKRHNMRFITVDIFEDAVVAIRKPLKKVDPRFKAVCMDGIMFLRKYPRNDITVLYLDAFDAFYSNSQRIHSEKKNCEYEVRGNKLFNKNAWKMHLGCIKVCHTKIVAGGLVVVDDTRLDESGNWDGKGKLAVPFLLNNSYNLVSTKRHTYKHCCCLQKMNDES